MCIGKDLMPTGIVNGQIKNKIRFNKSFVGFFEMQIMICIIFERSLFSYKGICESKYYCSNHRNWRFVVRSLKREIVEACQGNENCIDVYNEYHDKIKEVKGKIGRGLLLDIHGQTHGHGRTEFGYRGPIQQKILVSIFRLKNRLIIQIDYDL